MFQLLSVAIVVLALAAQVATAQSHIAEKQAAPEPIQHVSLPAHPFGVVSTSDGKWIFVSLIGDGTSASGVAVLSRSNGKASLVRVVPVQDQPAGMVLTHDGKLLIAAGGDYIVFLDVQQMIAGQEQPILGKLSDGAKPGSVYVNVTADDSVLFVSDERTATITVINLEKARGSGYTADSIVGKIPVGMAPIALTFSPGERYLYTTSQGAPLSYGWAAACTAEGRNSAQPKLTRPEGALIVVDVKRAKTDPANSAIAKIPAGCSPVRLAISPKGDAAYVTARNSNAVLVFDTTKLLTDADHARIATVPVGTSPVGVAVIEAGAKVVVTNSNRFSSNPNDKQSLTVIGAAKVVSGAAAVLGTIPAGGFPRELHLTSDQRTLLVTNFASKTLEVIDLATLSLER